MVEVILNGMGCRKIVVDRAAIYPEGCFPLTKRLGSKSCRGGRLSFYICQVLSKPMFKTAAKMKQLQSRRPKGDQKETSDSVLPALLLSRSLHREKLLLLRMHQGSAGTNKEEDHRGTIAEWQKIP